MALSKLLIKVWLSVFTSLGYHYLSRDGPSRDVGPNLRFLDLVIELFVV